MTLQEIADIASRYHTRMADAMVAACVARAIETGEPLAIPERGSARRSVIRSTPGGVHGDADWERLQRGNTDTRWCHV